MLLLLGLASATTFDELLARGEVSVLETSPDGKLRSVSAFARLPVPRDRVWALLTDFGAYAGWMPAVEGSKVVSSADRLVEVDWVIAVMGPNVSFRARYELDPAAGTIRGRQVSGALAGSSWEWRITGDATSTLVERTVRSTVVETNWFVRQAEDENHTLDYGINTAVAVVELRGLKRALAP